MQDPEKDPQTSAQMPLHQIKNEIEKADEVLGDLRDETNVFQALLQPYLREKKKELSY